MSGRVKRKWRPPLMLVLGGSLLVILVLPVIGLFVVDVLSPGIGRGWATVVVALLALLATLILGWLLWRLILAPVRALAARAEEIRAGAAPEPLPRYGTPEIGELGDAVLGMADVLRARELAVRSYTDHVTHELKTPLTAIRGAAELIASDPGLPDDLAPLVDTISSAEARAEHLLSAARDMARARTPDHHGRTRISELLAVDFPLGISIAADGEVPLDRHGLEVVVRHLAENAAEAGATYVEFTADRMPNGVVRLRVVDDGPGISPGNRSRVFEPFFTTRREAGGTGMGLAIVQTMLLAHGATIVLEPTETGAAFLIDFPESG